MCVLLPALPCRSDSGTEVILRYFPLLLGCTHAIDDISLRVKALYARANRGRSVGVASSCFLEGVREVAARMREERERSNLEQTRHV